MFVLLGFILLFRFVCGHDIDLDLVVISLNPASSEPGGNWDTSPVQGTGNGTLSCGLKSTSVTFNLTGSATWYMDGEFSASQAILEPKATLSNWVPDSHIIKFCESHSLPIVRNVAIAFAGSADVQAQAMLDIATLTVNVVNSAIATITSDDPSSSPCPSDRPVLKKHHKAVGIVSIMALVLIFLHAHFWKLVVIQLIFVAVGWLAFRKRQLQFYADKDVGPVQITMFLSDDEDVLRSEDISRKRTREHIVAWQVLDIGHSRRQFTVSIPCVPGKGEPQLGFATVEDVDGFRRAIKPLASAKAPAAWLGDEWEEMEDLDISEGLTNKSDRLHFAYGTYEEGNDESKHAATFRPFLLIRNVDRDEKYTVNPELYLHIFVSNGYTAGQYGHGIVKNIRGDMLTKRGIKVSSLKPISYWHIYKMNGKIRLEKTQEDMIELEEWDNV